MFKIPFLKQRLFLIIYLCSIHTVVSQEHQYSNSLIKEIIDACPICSKDKAILNVLKSDDFHNVHVQFAKGKIDPAFITINKLLEQQEITNKKKRYILYVIKGHILKRKKLYKEATQSLDSAITIGESIQSPNTVNLYGLSGQILLELEEYHKSIRVLEQWKTISSNDTINYSINLHNLGLSYLHINNFEKAEENLVESYIINKRHKDTLELARSSLNLAGLYYEQYKDSLAISYFEKGLAYAQQAGDLTTLESAYVNLAVVEENREDYKKALSYRKNFEKIKDSIWNRDQIWELAQQDKKVTVAVKEEIIKSEQWKKKGYSILAASLLFFLVIGGFFMYKIKKQQKVILAQKQHLDALNTTKDTLFSVLTHDLKTPIQSVQQKLFHLFTTTQKTTPKNTTYTTLVNESYHLSKKTAGLLDNVLHWVLASKNQLLFHKEKITVSSIIEQVIYDYTPILEERTLTLVTTINPSHSIYADRNTLKIILRNIIDNAIKFSPSKKEIHITAYEKETTCTIHITDQGIGFTKDTHTYTSTSDTEGKTSTGLGLQLCKQLIDKNGGSMIITSVPNEGTEVVLTLDRYST